MTIDRFATWDGAYVLGSLSATERRDFQAHLSNCHDCQERIAELSGLPGLLSLGRESLAHAPTRQSSVPDDAQATPLYAGLAAKVARRRRQFIVAAAASLLAVAGTSAALTASFEGADAPPPVAISGASSQISLAFAGENPRGLSAAGTLETVPWGTRLDWTCSYAGGSAYGGQATSLDYSLVVVSPSGNQTEVASWRAAPGSVVTPSATLSMPVSEIARLDIRDSSGATLLSAAP